MTRDPVVTVQELTVAEGVLRANDPSVALDTSQWAGQATAVIEELTRQLQTAASSAYLLTWKGRKVPRGAVVGGHTITYTQGNTVSAGFGEVIGTYRRLVEFGGPNGDLQQMVVFLT